MRTTRYAWLAAAGMTVVLSGCASEPMTAPTALAHAINTNLMPQDQTADLHPLQVVTVPVPSTATMDSQMAAWQRWQQEHNPTSVISPVPHHSVHQRNKPSMKTVKKSPHTSVILPYHPVKPQVSKPHSIVHVNKPIVSEKSVVAPSKKLIHEVKSPTHSIKTPVIEATHPISRVHHMTTLPKTLPKKASINPLQVRHSISPQTHLISQTPTQPRVRNVYTERLDKVFRQWKGTPYVYGGTTRHGIDCSAFVQVVYRDVYHYNLPRTTLQQVKLGRRIDPKNIQQGDLIFFHTGPDTRHVGVYVADGEFMESSSSRGVILSELSNPYWRQHFWQVRRII